MRGSGASKSFTTEAQRHREPKRLTKPARVRKGPFLRNGRRFHHRGHWVTQGYLVRWNTAFRELAGTRKCTVERGELELQFHISTEPGGPVCSWGLVGP